MSSNYARMARYAPRIQVVPTENFQGGLNLNADPFQLKNNESPDAWNVDFDPLGGFKQRDGVNYAFTSFAAPAGPALTQNPIAMWTYFQVGGLSQWMVQQGSRVFYANAGPGVSTTFVDVGTSAPWNVTTTGPMRSATFRDPSNLSTSACYIQRNAEQVPVKWNGTTGTALTNPATSSPSWNEDYAAPVKGRMPLAKFTVTHRDYVFVASTVEYEASVSGNVTHTSRVRWSHPGQPEDWRLNDWIDVEPGSNDAITGIASWGDRLLIFKNNSVFELLGYDENSFEVVNLSRTIGAITQDAIAVSEQGVYFFSWPEGLHFFDGEQIHNLFYNLRPIMLDGTVQQGYRLRTTVQWVKQRVWVSLPTSPGVDANTATFVFDPMLNGGRGAWTRYSFDGCGLGVGLEYQPPSGNAQWVAVYPVAKFGGEYSIVELHYRNGSNALWQDWLDPRWTTTSDGAPIVTRYQTPWVDLGNPALVKAWRRPTFVCRSDVDFTLDCQGYKNYDDSLQAGSAFQIRSTNAATGGEWDASTWDSGATWAASGNRRETIQKGARLGRATSVCLKVEGPKTLVDQTPWAVDSITWKYIPKRIRS